jgi:hypothetical protein
MLKRFAQLAAAVAMLATLLAAPVRAEEPAPTSSDRNVSLFVDLLLKAAAIENDRVAAIAAAPSDEAALEIHRSAERRLLREIETSPLPLDVYDDISTRAQTDIRLSMQIYAEIERRGEAVNLPEPASAPPSLGPALELAHAAAGF